MPFDIQNQIAVLMILMMHLFKQPLFMECLFGKRVNQGVFIENRHNVIKDYFRKNSKLFLRK